MTFQAGRYLATGDIPQRMGSEHPLVAPYRAYQCKDGEYINIGAGNDRIYTNLCKAIGREDMISDTRFVKNPDRVSNREELDQLIQNELMKKTRDEWLQVLEKIGVPCGPIYNMKDVFKDPHVLARKMMVEIEHPEVGSFKTFGKAIKFKTDDEREKHVYPPRLGEHNEEVLGALGYSQKEINKMT